MINEKRLSNLELLRVVAMFLIVLNHCTQHQLNEAWEILQKAPLSVNYIVTVIFGIWGSVANMIFVIISSWFLVDKKGIHSSRIFRLAFQAWVVSILITSVVMIFHLEAVSKTQIIKEVLTPIYHQYPFLLQYLIFYILVPFLQYFVQNISYPALKRLCLILTLCIPVYSLFFNLTTSGFAIFVYLFLMTAYLKKTEQNILEKYRGLLFGISCVSILSIMIAIKHIGGGTNIELRNYNILVLIMAFSLFYIFKNINIKYSPVINSISGKCFGIYLLHENMLCYDIWDDFFHMSDWLLGSKYYVIYWFGIVIIVFLACLILETILSGFIDRFLFKRWKGVWRVCERLDVAIKSEIFG